MNLPKYPLASSDKMIGFTPQEAQSLGHDFIEWELQDFSRKFTKTLKCWASGMMIGKRF